MKVIGKINGKEIHRDPYDLDYIEIDVVKDFVRSIEHYETNPAARIEVDMTKPEKPDYRLINCTHLFEDKFFEVVRKKKKLA